MSKTKGMIWFALDANTGLLHNVGLHEDWEAANTAAEEQFQLDCVWLIDEYDAKRWADYVNSEINHQNILDLGH